MKRPAGFGSQRPQPPGHDKPPRETEPREAVADSGRDPAPLTEPVPIFAARPEASGRAEASTPPEESPRADAPDKPRRTPGLRQAVRERRRVERQEIKRFTATSRRRRLIWLVSLGSVAALALVAVLLAYTPLFSVRQIVVEGAHRVNSDGVVDDLRSQLGSPFPLVDQGEIKAALMAYPLIESYAIESRPPDTLVVRIVERTPVGAIDTGSGFNVVDAAGVVIEASAQRPANYALISVGDAADGTAFEAAAEVLRSLPEEFRNTVDTVTATTRDDVALTMRDSGQQVVWGNADQAGLKIAVFGSLRTQYPQAAYLDVSSPDVPVVRP